MNPNEIRAQLEAFAATGATAEQIDSLTRAWLAIRGTSAPSYRPILDDRIKALGDTGNVYITAEGIGNNCISALSLKWGTAGLQMREVVTPPEEFENFVNDCAGWEEGEIRTATQSFEQGYGVVLSMSAENWAAWLEMFEVCELDDETAALLSA